ncbi:SDR family oxidoreductase [Pseudoalteromonas shioyasakiensis]|uniref:SDR family oxidoreductase n=1 Tax=Pseudoalteromonas shioyasakiensis TaxID=1190813 RepID=UPI002118934B|nr:SDR family oxidoreductase [Pseudoalteromonas shioyasakiensis]MCQ8877368.1 SDR family oxidoreductase [Pseudoalteromonas shioyasakiensis]
MRTIMQLQNMQNCWALITGGSGHVGQTAADTLLELGASVILLDRDSESLKELTLNKYKGVENVHAIVCDLANESAIAEAMKSVANITEHKLNVLVNNAAFVGTDKLTGWCVPFEQQAIDTFNDCLKVNLSAPFLLSQLAFELMKNQEQGSKSIINISSIYGVVGPKIELYEGTDMGNPAAYAASKAGLMQLTRWMSANVAPSVRVNNIVLGGIERGQPDTFVEKYNANVPLARMATEEDVKGAIAYLSSDLSSYMTGQSLFLDGGWTVV